jgi:hypothetical protein
MKVVNIQLAASIVQHIYNLTARRMQISKSAKHGLDRLCHTQFRLYMLRMR